MLLGVLYYIIIVHNFILTILHRYGSYNIFYREKYHTLNTYFK